MGFINFRATNALTEMVDNEAEKQKRTRSNMIKWILEQYFANKAKVQKSA